MDSALLQSMQKDIEKLNAFKDLTKDPHLFDLKSNIIDPEDVGDFMEHLCWINAMSEKFINQIKDAAKAINKV